MEQLLNHLDAGREQAVDRLKKLLSIPSVSTDPAYKTHVGAAAEWVRAYLAEIGFDARVHATEGHPVVLGHGGCDRDDVPHVLFYGHYDVQPPDPLELWTTPAFEPTVRDGAIYARGASDDKGQVCCFLEALRAWHETHGHPPVKVTVLIEGEEECGSVHLKPFLMRHRDELKADVVIISDTLMWNEQTVAITYALRGLLYYDVQLHGPSRDLHSGMYGGVLANPATMLVRVLGGIFDKDNRVTIPGFYDDVAPLSDAEKRQWDKLNFDDLKHCLNPVGVSTPFGEAGFSTLERKWARPSCDFNGLYGGYGGTGAKTVIPSYAGAKVSFRLAPNQDPQKISAVFEKWLQGHDVGGCRWKLTNLGGASPVMVSTNSPHIAAAQRAVERSTGRPAVLIREGATIPVVADFKTLLGIDSLLIGFGLADDRIHSPNEKFNLDCFHLGCRTHAMLLAEMRKCGNDE